MVSPIPTVIVVGIERPSQLRIRRVGDKRGCSTFETGRPPHSPLHREVYCLIYNLQNNHITETSHKRSSAHTESFIHLTNVRKYHVFLT